MDKRDTKYGELVLLMLYLWALFLFGKWLWQRNQQYQKLERMINSHFNTYNSDFNTYENE
jgi:hypothetical protein